MNYFIGIPYVNRQDLLLKAIQSIQGFWDHVIVVDNSENGDLVSGQVIPGEIELYRADIPLTFSQTMNLFQKFAKDRTCSFYFFMHNDAQAHPGAFAGLLSRVQQWNRDGFKWGCAFTNYDALSAFNAELISSVGKWDTVLPQYFSDFDYYRRIHLAGYQIMLTEFAVNHESSSTYRSNPYYEHLVRATFSLYEQYYEKKWGGKQGNEQYLTPFGFN